VRASFRVNCKKNTKLRWELVDERLSSFAAKQTRKETRKETQSSIDFGRDTVDAEAACIILQDYYNRTPATPQQ
jgi:RNase H-fold protein (predicted Holliday junction resolvase)